MTPSASDDGGSWRRVSSRYVWVSLMTEAAVGAVLIVFALLALFLGWMDSVWAYTLLGGAAAFTIIIGALTPRRVRAIGYQMRQDDFLFRYGVFFQRIVAVPYGRMQLVDINRGPLTRALGLAQLKFVTAAAATGVTLPGLTIEDATNLRDRLIALAETRRSGL
ncbi:PH domain-containing protein [Lysinibacter sp. HNR]|nr:PH domain-containing protein [Lysinibacter sp. HNR]WGD38660.1 PH domain-containing protein [Lysinibacter sp. HNR]